MSVLAMHPHYRSTRKAAEESHRNQRELPEAVVEKKVERDEDPDHRDLLQKEQREEESRAGFDRVRESTAFCGHRR